MEKNKKDKKKYSGFVGDCSEEQLQTLEKFKLFIKSHNNGEMKPIWEDWYLLRFLRARKFNMKETQKMWIDCANWRQKNDIDHCKNFYFPQMLELRKIYPHGHHKYDKQYRPIYIQRVGMVSVEQVKKLVDEETLLKYHAVGYQLLTSVVMQACTKQKQLETGDTGLVTQTCNIVDLKHFKITNASKAYGFIKPASEMGQNYYPQILGNMFIINAPMLFTGVWAIVKMWLDEKTREKIHILGSSYKKELLKYIQPQNLPDWIDGGTCKCPGGDCLSLNIGPWNPEGKEIHPYLLVKDKIEPKSTEDGQNQSQLVKEEEKKEEVKGSEKKEEVKEEKKEEVKPEKKKEEAKQQEKPKQKKKQETEEVKESASPMKVEELDNDKI